MKRIALIKIDDCGNYNSWDEYVEQYVARTITEWVDVTDEEYDILITSTRTSSSKLFGWRVVEQIVTVEKTISELLEEAVKEYEAKKRANELAEKKKREKAEEKKKKEVELKRKQLEKLKRELGE